MRNRGVVALCMVIACGTVRRPDPPDRRLDIRQTGTVFEASNGYMFAVLPEAHSSVIRLDVRYPVGSAHDPKGKEGLAHLVEHLLFDVEYTKSGAKTSVGAELGRLALSWNAETHPDYTVYQAVFAAESLADVMALEVNRLSIGCAGLTPEIFAREREVVLNELRQRQGASGAQLSQLMHAELFPEGHPYRSVDSVETVAKLELHDACDFLTTQYQRGKAVVVVAGDVSEADVQRAASKQFVRLRKRNLAAVTPPAVVNPPPGTARLKADIDEPGYLIATWSLPPQGTREYRLLSTAWPMIAGQLELWGYVYKWGYDSFTTIYGGAHAPVLAVGIALRSLGDAEEAKTWVGKSVRAAFEALGHDEEDERWRSRFYGRAESLLARWESLGARNDMFGDFMMFDTTPEYVIGQVTELKKASPGAVRSLGERWLGASHARYLIIEPSGTLPMNTATGFSGGGEAHRIAVDGTLADQPVPLPKYRPRVRIERYELGNGLDVMLWPNGSVPVARGRLVIDSGYAHEPAGREGLASMIGASSAGPDTLVFDGRELSIFVDNLVVELGYELRRPGLPMDDDQKEFIKARLRNARAAERRTYEADRRAALFGTDHPYARSPMTEQTVDKLHHDLVRDWSGAHMVANNATLIITGSFDAELVKKHIAFNVDQVGGGRDSPDIEVASGPDEPRYVAGTTTKPSPTVELDMSFLTTPGIDKDHGKRLILEGLLDAELSRLRSQQAVTYGFYASFNPRKGGGVWRIGGEADASRAAEATTTLLAILDEIRADAESYRASFVLARQKVIEGLLVAATDSYAVSGQLSFMAQFDLDDTYFDRLADAVAKVTLTDFHAFLVRELPARRFVFGAFGTTAATDAALAAAKAKAGH